MLFRADFRKGLLDLMNAFFIIFCKMRDLIVKGMLVFCLIDFPGSWLWIFMIVLVRMVAGLLIVFIGSGLSWVIRREIWSCRMANCLEREELMASQLVLWSSLTCIECETDLLMLVVRLKRMAEWFEERLLLLLLLF